MSRKILVTFLLASLCACGAKDAYVKVRKVEIQGNHAASDREIIGGLVTRKPAGLLVKDYAQYDEVSVARDRERIEAFFRGLGYFSAEVKDVVVKKLGKEWVDVIFEIDEGKPTRVTSLDIRGYPVPLPRDVPLPTVGEIYRQDRWLQSKEILERALIEAGYAHADVGGAVAVDRDEHTADLNVEADPGPLVSFGKLTIRGARRIPRSSVMARLDWKEGDRFDPARVRRTQGRLYQLGFFASVGIEIDHEGRLADAPTTIRLREAQRHELKLGVGVALDDANLLLRPRVGYSVRPRFDPLLTLDLDARPGIIVMGQGEAGNLAGEITASAERHDLLGPRIRGSLGLTAEVVELETYSARGGGVKLGLDRPFLRDKLLAGVGYQLRLLDFVRVSSALTDEDRARVSVPTDEAVPGLGVEYRLGFFEQSLAYDGRDSPLDAHRGLYAELRVEEAGVFSGSQFSYVKLTPEVRGYLSPWKRLVFAGKARYGTAFGSKLPITQRYFAGGASSHRGFTFRRLSPMSSAMTEDGRVVPVGGSRLLEASVETRLDLFKLLGRWVGIVGFLDAGDVTTAGDIPNPLDLHLAAGLGLRYDTVIGPVRFDVGYRLNRFGPGEPDPGDRLAFHLSLGEAF